jgi:hypothetical protein
VNKISTLMRVALISATRIPHPAVRIPSRDVRRRRANAAAFAAKRHPAASRIALAMLLFALPHAVPAEDAPAFPDLPEAIRSRVLTGAPRSSREIPSSGFGAHTTMMEGPNGDVENMERIVEWLSKAGYKWVMEATPDLNVDKMAVEDVERELIAPRLPDMVKYAMMLKSVGIECIVRLDIPNLLMKIHRAPTDEDLAKIRAYMEPLVRGLSPVVRHWQFNNEPNMGNENPRFPPEYFVEWSRAVGEILRELQPDAVYSAPGFVMLQCMAEKPYPWVRRSFEAGLLEPLDWLTYHPYRMPETVDNIPEHASEFKPWTIWGSYYHQVTELRRMVREHNGGRDIPLAITEDGLPTEFSPDGEQEISPAINAKYELRRMLLDTWLGVSPRVTFIFFMNNTGNIYYDFVNSFSIITPGGLHPRPIYYAAQNLMAVLDDTYRRDDDIAIDIRLDEPPAEGTDRLIRTEADAAGMTPGGMEGLYAQTYTKAHDGFEELLVFFWSAEPAHNKHVRRQATMTLADPGWSAPLQINLMAMPNSRAAREKPRPLQATIEDGVVTLPVEVRDYPLLIKWVRTEPGSDR